MMATQLSDLLESVEPLIYKRGEAYYKEGMISSLEAGEDGLFEAKVLGSSGDAYHVCVKLNKDQEVESLQCSCPFDLGPVCKHQVAVVLGIQNGKFKAGRTKKALRDIDISQLLSKVSHENLKQFVVDFAKRTESFRREVIQTFGELDPKEELAQVKGWLRSAIQENTYRGYIDYRGCNSICLEMDQVIELAEQRRKESRFHAAYLILLYTLETGAKLASGADDSSGLLSGSMGYSLECLESVVKSVEKMGTPKEKADLYHQLILQTKSSAYDGWSDWKYDLLRLAAFLVTKKNVKEMRDVLEMLRAKLDEQCGISAYYEEHEKLVLLTMTEKLEGEEKAYAFMMENIHLDAFLRMAVNKAEAEKRFADAEGLLLQRIEKDRSNDHCRMTEWQERLYHIYELDGNQIRQKETARQLMLLASEQYYDVYKQLALSDGSWQSVYPLLLRELEQSWPRALYRRILESEGEWKRLFQAVQVDPFSVFTHGPALIAHGEERTIGIYQSELARQAQEANARPEYQKVCGFIKQLFKAGATQEAKDLLDQFKLAYPRRPAMQDELNKLEKSLARLASGAPAKGAGRIKA